jgi:hypothetical protein
MRRNILQRVVEQSAIADGDRREFTPSQIVQDLIAGRQSATSGGQHNLANRLLEQSISGTQRRKWNTLHTFSPFADHHAE